MTTLELARLVATAARAATEANAARDVLAALTAHDCWFCRVTIDANGIDRDMLCEAPPPRRAPLPLEEDRPLPFEETPDGKRA